MADEKKGKIVLASGVFDLLHLGHVRFLEEAKALGGAGAELIVIVARDSTVEKRKGERPVIPENQRCALVASLRVVDEAMLGFRKFDIGRVIRTIRPDIVAVGHDQKDMEKIVKNHVLQNHLEIRVVRIGEFGEDELNSSSKIKRRIVEHYRR